jgi:ABC-2 type transport system ATP-binding protein
VLGDAVLPATDPLEITARLDSNAQAARLVAGLSEGGIEIGGFSVGNPSLDEVFLALTGHPAEDTPSEATP